MTEFTHPPAATQRMPGMTMISSAQVRRRVADSTTLTDPCKELIKQMVPAVLEWVSQGLERRIGVGLCPYTDDAILVGDWYQRYLHVASFSINDPWIALWSSLSSQQKDDVYSAIAMALRKHGYETVAVSARIDDGWLDVEIAIRDPVWAADRENDTGLPATS